MKQDIEPIGETYDGQKIVKFRYKGQPGKQIGLVAQDVEQHHPEAVGLAGGYKTVDYDEATRDAARRGHFRHGGLAASSEGGAVVPEHWGEGYALGGDITPPRLSDQLASLLSAQQQMYGGAGLYGGAPGRSSMGLYGAEIPKTPVGQLAVAHPPQQHEPTAAEVAGTANAWAGLGEKLDTALDGGQGRQRWRAQLAEPSV